MKAQLNFTLMGTMMMFSSIFLWSNRSPDTPQYVPNNITYNFDWQTYQYPEGKFKIDLPAEPSSEVDGDYKTITAVGDKQVYRVTFLTKDGFIEDKEGFFQHSFDMYGSIKGEVKKMQENGLESRYATVKKGLSTFLIKVWQSDSRIWTLVCAKQTGKIDETMAERFFDSFKVEISGITTTSVATNIEDTSPSSKQPASGDLKSYINSKVIPDLNFLSKAQNWYASTLTDFLELDAPKFLETVNGNKAQMAQLGFNGKKALEFAQNIDNIKPIASQVIENYLQMVKNSGNARFIEGKTRIAFLSDVATLADDFMQIFPEDAGVKSAKVKAETEMQNFVKSAPFISSPFHVQNMNDIVLFTKNIKVGQEPGASTTEVVAPDKGTKAIGYFSKNLLSSTNRVHLNITLKGQYKQVQQLFYWQNGLKDLLEKTGYAEFDFFPNPSELNFKSPYQFDPHINVLAYFLAQAEGQYEMELAFEIGRKQNMGGDTKITKTFTLDLSAANKQKIKTLHEALLQKRIETIMMPKCTDNTNNIGNKDGFAKYGKLLKYTQTDEVGVVRDQSKIGKPIIGKATGGWAAVELPDGSVELLKIGLSMPNGQTFWKFTALSTIPDDYEMVGATNYHPGKGKYGYLMKKENVAKCQIWE